MYHKPSDERPFNPWCVLITPMATLKDLEDVEDAYFNITNFDNRTRIDVYSLKRKSRKCT